MWFQEDSRIMLRGGERFVEGFRGKAPGQGVRIEEYSFALLTVNNVICVL